MAKKEFCNEHYAIHFAIFGDEGGNSPGLVQEVQKLKFTVAFSIGVMAVINFIWIFFAYPWLHSLIGLK